MLYRCQLAEGSLLNDNALFRSVYNGIGQILPEWLCWLGFVIAGFIIMFILTNAVLLGAALFVWSERRVIARMQNRVGPNRWGPFGLFTPIADVLKLMTKEDMVPRSADRIAFTLVPIVMMAPVILMLAVVPFAQDTALANINVGVLFVVAITAISGLGIFMAGWASGNRYALFGAMRGVAILISYEVPAVLALVGVVLSSRLHEHDRRSKRPVCPLLGGATPSCLHFHSRCLRRAEPHSLSMFWKRIPS